MTAPRDPFLPDRLSLLVGAAFAVAALFLSQVLAATGVTQ